MDAKTASEPIDFLSAMNHDPHRPSSRLSFEAASTSSLVSTLALLALTPTAIAQVESAPAVPAAASTPVTESPFALVQNVGQWDSPAVLSGHMGAVGVQLLPGTIQFQLDRPTLGKGMAVRLTLEGGDPECLPRGESKRLETRSYFMGSDESQWHTDVPSFTSALYEDIAPGVDLRLREAQGRLEWDLLVDAGTSADGLVMHCEGVDDIVVDDEGELVLDTPLGAVRMGLPTSWTVAADGAKSPVTSTYIRLDEHRFAFELAGRDGELPLVIDPGVEWSTYLGGSTLDVGVRTVIAPNGNVYTSGYTNSTDFPTVAGGYDLTAGGEQDGFVSVFDPTGSTLLHSTYLGGSRHDAITGIDIMPTGEVLVCGYTISNDLPTTSGAFQTAISTGWDGFVARFDAALTTLEYSTYLGSISADWVTDIEVDATGRASICGHTRSSNFPATPGAFQTTRGGLTDVFVARLDPNGNGAADLVWCSFLGGSFDETFNSALPPMTIDAYITPDLTVTADGAITVSGTTSSSDFPTTPGAYQSASTQSGLEGFVARFSVDGSALQFATLLGGAGADVVFGMTHDAMENWFLVGTTTSVDFPTTAGAFQTVHSSPGSQDAFVTQLSNDGSSVVYSTIVGASGRDNAQEVIVEASGVINIVGDTYSPDFPVTPGAANPLYFGELDAYFSRLDTSLPGQSQLIYSTFLGGTVDEFALGFDLTGNGSAIIGGPSDSPDIAVTPGSFQPTFGGGVVDAFVLELDYTGFGTSYCGPGAVNSTGSPGEISTAGSPVIAVNDVTLSASSLPNGAFGFFLASQTQGFFMMPGGSQGNLCLAGAIGRYVGPGQIQNTGSNGAFSLALDLTMMPTPTGLVAAQPGETWNFQAWHRDSVGGSATSNLTDGISVTFQ